MFFKKPRKQTELPTSTATNAIGTTVAMANNHLRAEAAAPRCLLQPDVEGELGVPNRWIAGDKEMSDAWGYIFFDDVYCVDRHVLTREYTPSSSRAGEHTWHVVVPQQDRVLQPDRERGHQQSCRPQRHHRRLLGGGGVLPRVVCDAHADICTSPFVGVKLGMPRSMCKSNVFISLVWICFFGGNLDIINSSVFVSLSWWGWDAYPHICTSRKSPIISLKKSPIMWNHHFDIYSWKVRNTSFESHYGSGLQ